MELFPKNLVLNTHYNKFKCVETENGDFRSMITIFVFSIFCLQSAKFEDIKHVDVDWFASPPVRTEAVKWSRMCVRSGGLKIRGFTASSCRVVSS